MHRLTRKFVAIKAVERAKLRIRDTREKLNREINNHKEMKHDHHVRQLEVFKTDKHYLMVMELCPGGDLVDYVKQRKQLSEPLAKHLFYQMMLGIEYMHKKDIVHLDIKLENLLLDGHGKVKIADFGLS